MPIAYQNGALAAGRYAIIAGWVVTQQWVGWDNACFGVWIFFAVSFIIKLDEKCIAFA
ncbi:MAG: hypothetical protein V3V10_10115 [Planctomycetota bacterium]